MQELGAILRGLHLWFEPDAGHGVHGRCALPFPPSPGRRATRHAAFLQTVALHAILYSTSRVAGGLGGQKKGVERVQGDVRLKR